MAEMRNERTIAQEIVREGVDLTVKCLKTVKIAGLKSAVSGITAALGAYQEKTAGLAPNPEGRKIARQVVREEAAVLVSCIGSITSAKVQNLTEGFSAVLKEYISHEPEDMKA